MPITQRAAWRRTIIQTLILMKLSALLLTVTFLNVHAAVSAQNVTLSGKDLTLRQIFAAIKKQTGYVLFANESFLDQSKTMSLTVVDTPLEQLLDIVLKDEQVDYALRSKTIILSRKPALNPAILPVQMKALPVKGRIVDASGKPVARATIRVKGGNKGTSTDAAGIFSLDANEGDVLEITSVGFAPVTLRMQKGEFIIEATGKETGSLLSPAADALLIRLASSTSLLDEIQVIAYGTTSRRLSTGNVSTVKSGQIAKSPVLNPMLALQGRVPGITIESASGLPGSGIKVRVQGQNSLGRGNNPLYVVDGVPYPSNSQLTVTWQLERGNDESKTGNDNGTKGNGGSPLNYINPNDIESIDILKDADATSIYGSRAANGAILITTKRAKAGAPQFDVNLQQGVGHVPRMMKLLNTQQYLEVRKEAFRNAGLAVPDASTPPTWDNFDLTLWDQNRYTDWQKELIGGTAGYTNVYASATGGSNLAQYLVTGSYRRQSTVFPGNYATQGGGLNFNANTASANQRFKSSVSVQYFQDNNNLPFEDITSRVMIAPNAPALYKEDGSLNWETQPDGTSGFYNPLAAFANKVSINTTNIIGNGSLSYKILPDLELSSTFGYNNLRTDAQMLIYLESTTPEWRYTAVRSMDQTASFSKTWQVEPQLTYRKAIGRGKLDAMIGSTLLKKSEKASNLVAYGVGSDMLIADPAAHPNQRIWASEASDYRYNALFARLSYNYADKYIFTLSGRRDGSSRFGAENQLHSFGSVAGAWIFSDEKAIDDAFPFLSFGKLRASYGTTGNDNIGDYVFLSLYFANTNGVDMPFQGIVALDPLKLSNPFLQWEETKKTSAGIDLGFFEDKVLFNATWYRNRSSNQLINYLLPATAGFGSIERNFPATVQNTGWEFSLNTRNISRKNFSWQTDANLSMNRNKLAAFPGLERTSYRHSLVVGEPINVERYFNYAGVDPQTGLYTYRLSDGTITSTPSNPDKHIYQTAFPRFIAGLSNTFTYKNFQLDFLFQIVSQNGVTLMQGNQPGSMNNQPVYVLDRWQKPGDVANIQRYMPFLTGEVSQAYYGYQQSTAGYGDASFIRLKNMSASWTFPDAFLHTVKMKNARVFANAQNLFTYSPYKGLDPEHRSGFFMALPSLRVITLGLHLTF